LVSLPRFERVLNVSVGICRKTFAIQAGRSVVLDRRFFNERVEVSSILSVYAKI